jgi:hypothetical protein
MNFFQQLSHRQTLNRNELLRQPLKLQEQASAAEPQLLTSGQLHAVAGGISMRGIYGALGIGDD